MPKKNYGRGFANMNKDKQRSISPKAGETRKEEINPEGLSDMGKKGSHSVHERNVKE